MAWTVVSHDEPYQSRAGFWFVRTLLQDGAEQRYIETKYSRDLPMPGPVRINRAVADALQDIYNKPVRVPSRADSPILEALRTIVDRKTRLQAIVTLANNEIARIDAGGAE